MGPTGEFRVLQVHPTRRCNLECAHCYSRSGPRERETLAAPLLAHAIADAAELGFNVLGVSGGEPLLYAPLSELLHVARAHGLLTTVTSNGTLLYGRHLDTLVGLTDLLAISLDGVPASHDRMRAAPGAFARMERNLAQVRAAGIPFGFIFTLTLYNVHELDWVARFAAEQGASLLQIHPLELAGRARDLLAGERPDAREASVAYLEACRIQRAFADRLRVQLDFLDREIVAAEPWRVLACERDEAPDARFSSVVSPLIVEADRTVVPLQYGFSRRFALGRLGDARLCDLAPRWLAERAAEFRTLCQRAHAATCDDRLAPFSNWYERISAAATDPVESGLHGA